MSDPHAAPKTVLLTRLSSRPGEIRDAVVADLMETAGAQAGNWYTLRHYRGSRVLLCGENRYCGPATVAEALRTVEGQPYAQITFGETADHLGFGFSPATRVNAFEIRNAADICTAFVERFWAPGELHSVIGLNAVVDHRYAGWLGAFRARSHPAFEPALLRRLKLRVPGYLALLGAARLLDAARPGEAAAVIVVDAKGSVSASSAEADAWLQDADFEARIAGEVAAFGAGSESFRAFMVGRAAVRLLALSGEPRGGCVALVTPTEETDLACYLALRPREREVFSHAARGLKVREIASAMKISPETVRSHIKAIYERLGIKSRAELGAARGMLHV